MSTGLDDFGDDDWEPTFRLLLGAFETNADLTVIGRLSARGELLRCLQLRLTGLTDLWNREPDPPRRTPEPRSDRVHHANTSTRDPT